LEVTGGRGDGGMAEAIADTSERSAGIENMRRGGMAQPMDSYIRQPRRGNSEHNRRPQSRMKRPLWLRHSDRIRDWIGAVAAYMDAPHFQTPAHPPL